MMLAPAKMICGTIALALSALVANPAAYAQSVPVNKCTGAKTKCMSAKVKGLLACHAKAETKGLALDPGCTGKVMDTFADCIAKAEAKPPCLTMGDAASLEAAIDAFVLDVVQQLDPGYPAPVLNKCSAAKKKAVSAKTSAKLGCLAKAFQKTGLVDPVCLTKAETKHAAAFGKAEAKPPCLTTGDEAALEATVDQFFSDQVAALGGGDPLCGNGVNEPSEACDASAPSSGWGACGPDFACVACNCACPTRYEVAVDAADSASTYDLGWEGFAFRQRFVTNSTITFGLGTCSNTDRPCGTCNVTGVVTNAAGTLANRRCTNDTSVACTSDAPCSGGGGTCRYYLGAWQGLANGGITWCLANYVSAATGTVDIETGDSTITADAGMEAALGLTIDQPCSRCLNDPTSNDGVKGGTCNGGPRNGLTCDANATQPDYPDFGTTSLDCPPTTTLIGPTAIVMNQSFSLTSEAGSVTRTVTAASPNCTGAPGEKCLCDTCNSAAAEPCTSNADCPTPAGPIGPICGGKRCLGGTNDGTPCKGGRQCVGGSNANAACTLASACPGGTCNPFCTQLCVGGSNDGAACSTNSQCPGSGAFCPLLACGVPGDQTKPSACIDDPGTPGVLDCVDTGDGIGECTQGPVSGYCSIASGHPQRGCFVDSECGTCIGGGNAGGICNASSACPGSTCSTPPPLSCAIENRPCHLTGSAPGFGNVGTGTLIANGMVDAPVRDVAHPILGSVDCAPYSGAAFLDVAGLPGPLRMSRKATVRARQ